MSRHVRKHPVALSVGLLVGHDEEAVLPTLESVFRQSVFAWCGERREQCEILVLAPSCGETAVALARQAIDGAARTHAHAEDWTARVLEIPEAGEAAAWNRFVHEFSAVEARYLCSIRPGVWLPHRETLARLLATLERFPRAPAAASRPCPDVVFKPRLTWRERQIARRAERADLSDVWPAGLACLRAEVARDLHIPRDLGAAHEVFLHEALCGGALSRQRGSRIVAAAGCRHVIAAPVDAPGRIEQRRREMMGRMVVHLLACELPQLRRGGAAMADVVRDLETRDPGWLRQLAAAHLRRRRLSWPLERGTLTAAFRRLHGLDLVRLILRLPEALEEFFVTLAACARANRALRCNVEAQGRAAIDTGAPGVPQTGPR